jgi:cytochrome oxidase Cu insertion factor (SCO1/SenC/PrrC family)
VSPLGRRTLLWGAAAAAFVGAAAALAPGPPPRRVGGAPRDFSLPDGRGADFRLSDLRGRPVLLSFGWVRCPDVCPTTLARVAEALRQGPPGAAGVFVSVDPADTPAVAAAFAAHFHPALIGLAGPPALVGAVAAAWGVRWQQVPLPGSALGAAIDHDPDVFVLDREGRLVDRLPPSTPAAALAAALGA